MKLFCPLLVSICALALISQNKSSAQTNLTQSIEQLPPSVKALSDKIQGKSPEEVLKLTYQLFGKPSRDVGSGVFIPVWDLPEGMLFVGRFKFKSGDMIWLIKTHNTILENITGGYEMSSSANGKWLGDIVLGLDGGYKFTVADAFPDEWQGNQKAIFFHHIEGTYKIEYPPGLGPETLLETVPDGATVATLFFLSKEGYKSKFFIAADTQSRLLFFRGSTTLGFEMDKSWKNYWK